MTLRLCLSTLLAVFLVVPTMAGRCLVIGDSQSAHSLEKLLKNPKAKGLVPSLRSGLKDMGLEVSFYALKGSGARDWIDAPAHNTNTLIGLADKENLTPFQLQSDRPELGLTTVGNKTFVDQVFAHHAQDEIDCFVIQLGDNDIFRERSAFYMSELVKHVLGQDKAPRMCAVIAPTFKEKSHKDDFPFITDQKKLNYITQVRHQLQKNGLLADCPVVSTLGAQMEGDLNEAQESSKKRLTYDGLFYNERGGEIWARNILRSRPFLGRL